jgi:hypothetical protein
MFACKVVVERFLVIWVFRLLFSCLEGFKGMTRVIYNVRSCANET